MTRDPYSPPQSALGGTDKLNRSLYWKLYFGFMILVSIIALLGLSTVEDSGLIELLSAILIVPAMIGLYGYTFSKKILNRRIWQFNFYIQISWDILYHFIANSEPGAGMDQTAFIVSIAIMWILSIP